MTDPYGRPMQTAQPPHPYAVQQHGVGQQHWGYVIAAAPRSPRTTLGVWSLILGLSGFLLPFGLNSVVAIVLGIVGIVREERRGLSIAGLSIGAFVLLVWTPAYWTLVTLALSLAPLLFLPFLY